MKRALFVAAALTGAVALAFVLPASAILRRMANARDEQRLFTLRVDGSISFFGETAAEAGAALSMPADRGEVQSDASILLKVPDRCRLELNPLEGARSAAIFVNAKARQEGNPIAAVQTAISEVCSFLATRSSSEGESKSDLDRHLRTRGVDVAAETSLARFGGDIAYVIGKRADDAPQFWAYKADDPLPARLRFTDAGGVRWDVRFFDYASPVTGDWFPRQIEVVKNGELAMRFTALAADPRGKLEDKLF